MLRDYQQIQYDEIREALGHHLNPVAVAPCRSGKTYIIEEICANAHKKGSNVLILAHRRLLLRQHSKIIQNARLESVFTEVNHLGEHGKVDLIIIDEAHISGANSYLKVCEYYKCPVIGFTATAKRLDNKPLSIFQTVINGISADELIDRGLIADYDLYAPKLNINLDNVKMSGADFNNEELGATMMNNKIYGDIIKYYNQLATEKQAIAYCVNIEHSKSICDLFNDNGIPACHMDATTPENIRDQLMNDFKSGKYKILCNCNLISEGITLPECECCLLLRPTQSETLYIQQACRCLTPNLNKRAIIIDYVGNCYAHGMPTEKRIYTLKPQKIRNSNREPDVIVRQCKNCLLVYSGNDRICPYCGHDNGKTRKQIEQEERAELERMTRERIKQERMEVGRCRTKDELIALARKRGYSNPVYWAMHVYNSRQNKIKKI